ncbi:MAG: galactosyldiacylglycerol synthase [Anaerolineae bacterium]|nr:galactosyldiacylglycerol synthase [Anaerolineae bacterium]
MKKRIRLLYADTGGGHRSAAEAILQGLRMQTGDLHDIALLNAFNMLPFPFKGAEETYPIWVNYARMVYGLGFHATNGRRRVVAMRWAMEPLADSVADEFLRVHPADLYISCHPGYNMAVPDAIRRNGNSARFVNVVTDLVSGHVAAFNPLTDHCIVPTDEARRQAIENMVPPDRVTVCGQPVWPDFRQRMGNRAETRAALNLREDLPMVLMMSGGDGMGTLGPNARELAFSNLPMQLVVVTGRNKAVKAELEFINARVPTTILGFVGNVPELMGASDILCTKAGPGTISEAFIAGLPILLFDRVPGQEDGNVDYVVNQGAGAWCPTPFALTRTLRQWLAYPARLDRPAGGLSISGQAQFGGRYRPGRVELLA